MFCCLFPTCYHWLSFTCSSLTACHHIFLLIFFIIWQSQVMSCHNHAHVCCMLYGIVHACVSCFHVLLPLPLSSSLLFSFHCLKVTSPQSVERRILQCRLLPRWTNSSGTTISSLPAALQCQASGARQQVSRDKDIMCWREYIWWTRGR